MATDTPTSSLPSDTSRYGVIIYGDYAPYSEHTISRYITDSKTPDPLSLLARVRASFSTTATVGLGMGGLLRTACAEGLVAALELSDEMTAKGDPTPANRPLHVILVTNTMPLQNPTRLSGNERYNGMRLGDVAVEMSQRGIRVSVIQARRGIRELDEFVQTANRGSMVPLSEGTNGAHGLKLVGLALPSGVRSDLKRTASDVSQVASATQSPAGKEPPGKRARTEGTGSVSVVVGGPATGVGVSSSGVGPIGGAQPVGGAMPRSAAPSASPALIGSGPGASPPRPLPPTAAAAATNMTMPMRPPQPTPTYHTPPTSGASTTPRPSPATAGAVNTGAQHIPPSSSGFLTPAFGATAAGMFQNNPAELHRMAAAAAAAAQAQASQPPPTVVDSPVMQVDRQQAVDNKRLQQASLNLLQQHSQAHQSHMERNRAIVGGPPAPGGQGQGQQKSGASPSLGAASLGVGVLSGGGVGVGGGTAPQGGAVYGGGGVGGGGGAPQLSQQQLAQIVNFARNPEAMNKLDPQRRNFVLGVLKSMKEGTLVGGGGGAAGVAGGQGQGQQPQGQPPQQQQQQQGTPPVKQQTLQGPQGHVGGQVQQPAASVGAAGGGSSNAGPSSTGQGAPFWSGGIAIQAVGPAGQPKSVGCLVSAFARGSTDHLDRTNWPDKIILQFTQIGSIRQDLLRQILTNQQTPIGTVRFVPDTNNANAANNLKSYETFRTVLQKGAGASGVGTGGCICRFGAGAQGQDRGGVVVMVAKAEVVGLVFGAGLGPVMGALVQVGGGGGGVGRGGGDGGMNPQMLASAAMAAVAQQQQQQQQQGGGAIGGGQAGGGQGGGAGGQGGAPGGGAVRPQLTQQQQQIVQGIMMKNFGTTNIAQLNPQQRGQLQLLMRQVQQAVAGRGAGGVVQGGGGQGGQGAGGGQGFFG
ncbi:hypothetical protein HDV00_002775 [Rhizophlyctis rosea]|nr:hypothetical protein HDV00_002775 [Rhizophlyctis rosea]